MKTGYRSKAALAFIVILVVAATILYTSRERRPEPGPQAALREAAQREVGTTPPVEGDQGTDGPGEIELLELLPEDVLPHLRKPAVLLERRPELAILLSQTRERARRANTPESMRQYLDAGIAVVSWLISPKPSTSPFHGGASLVDADEAAIAWMIFQGMRKELASFENADNREFVDTLKARLLPYDAEVHAYMNGSLGVIFNPEEFASRYNSLKAANIQDPVLRFEHEGNLFMAKLWTTVNRERVKVDAFDEQMRRMTESYADLQGAISREERLRLQQLLRLMSVTYGVYRKRHGIHAHSYVARDNYRLAIVDLEKFLSDNPRDDEISNRINAEMLISLADEFNGRCYPHHIHLREHASAIDAPE